MTDRTQRAQRAKQIMTDELVVEALETMEREIVDAWKGAAYPDAEGREVLYRQLWSIRYFKAFFERVMTDGVMHQHELQQLKRSQFKI